jgi:hypothetical protein
VHVRVTSDRLPGDGEATQDSEAVQLYREHDRLIGEWWANRRKLESILATRGRADLREFRRETDPDMVDDLRARDATEAMRSAEEAVQVIRQDMRNRGLTPPRLGLESAYIEPETFESTTLDELAQTVSRNKRISLSEAIHEVYRIAGEPLPESHKDDTEGEQE